MIVTTVLVLSLMQEVPQAEDAPSRGGGIAMIVSGGGALGVGALCLLASLPFWIDGLDIFGGGAGMSEDDKVDIAIAGALTTVGLAAAIAGAVLLPLGIRKLRAANGNSASADLQLTPLFALDAHGANFGLAGRF